MSDKTKVAVIYYSMTGTNYQLAREAQKAAEAAGAEVRLRKVQELAPQEVIEGNDAWREHAEATKDVQTASLDDLNWADAVIFGVPTRYGNMPAQLKQFIDTTGGLWFEGKLADKVYSAFTSAQNPNGGQESTLLSIYNVIHHWGGILVTPGYTNEKLFASGGNPYGTSVTADGNAIPEEKLEAIRIQTNRVVEFAKKLR